MNYPLPPSLVALRAFAISARSRSFARASEELGISPGAVTQHIHTVEKWVGHPLFRRTGRSVVPTDAAEAALPLLLEGFDLLIDGADVLRSFGTQANVIKVQAPPAFSSKWLLPRLEAFHASHPGNEVWVSVENAQQTSQSRSPDVVIRYGLNTDDGFIGEPLLQDSVVVVASPDFIQRHGPLQSPDDIALCPLIHYTGQKVDKSFPDWASWLRARGVHGFAATGGARFDHPGLLIEQAIAGRGIALAKWIVACSDIQAGRLICVFPDRTPVSSSYWIQRARGRTLSEPVRIFERWLRASIERDIAEPSAPPLALRRVRVA